MAKTLKYSYDPLDLIELIEQRPCIWDKTSDDYKDRIKKGHAWTEIYNFLIDGYEDLEDIEKLTAGRAITDKWKHIRDAFALSLKKNSNRKHTKKYLYYDELQFLMNILQKDDPLSITYDDMETQENGDEISHSTHSDVTVRARSTSSRLRKRKNSSTTDTTDMTILKALKATAQSPTDIDEDAGFFASVTPSVKKFNEDQKLTFRMGVLTLIQQIKNQTTP